MRKFRQLNVSRLRELFTYDPITGVLRRLTGRNAGKVCGTKSNTGHLQVGVDGKITCVHRIAWAVYYGEYPSLEIDHVSGDGADNRLCNLRLATSAQNNRNRRLSTRNKTGIKSVFRVKWGKRSKWRVAIGYNGGKYYITHFDTFDDAVAHATQMRAKLHDQFARAA
jgi:hypothetical protein